MATTVIPRTNLGSQGLQVSKLGYGCMGLTGVYNKPLSEEDGIFMIKYAFEKGITFFDTSDVYGATTNEIIVGKALKQLPRDKIQLATKFGIVFSADGKIDVKGSPEYVGKCCEESLKRLDVEYIDLYYPSKIDTSIPIEETALKQLPREKIQLATKFGIVFSADGKMDAKGSPEYVRKCCEESLKRLDVEYIDLYYQHRIDTSIPIEETIGELKKLVEEGKIKYIGLSEASVDTIRRAHAVHPITAIQLEWSLWTRDIEVDIIPVCRELGIGIVPYSPLGRGFFSGKAVVESLPENSSLVNHPRFRGENLEKNKVFYTRIADLAKKYGCTPGQLALAWVLHQGDDVVPIPGTTKTKNLDENIGSLNIKLSQRDLQEIADSLPADEVVGIRTYESMNHKTWRFADTPQKS
ncbi:probable aldo-keto reductase 1 isoform X1 [Cryptomeria japonica]|uniref:probable aldo-keto reductase 1 isoform X1 n=1 Tax=Cryptomeria japonica TaxID=3369 RepID=UPI0025AD05FC|nr:probable aldo-keto reductase 1 isoform X1 [Cryptomeria japonica]